MTAIVEVLQRFEQVQQQRAHLKETLGYANGIVRAAAIILETINDRKPLDRATWAFVEEVLTRLTEAEKANRATMPGVLQNGSD